MTRIEVLSSYNTITGFQGSTVRNTSVTKIEKKGHQMGQSNQNHDKLVFFSFSFTHMAGFTQGGKWPLLNCFFFCFAVKPLNW